MALLALGATLAGSAQLGVTVPSAVLLATHASPVEFAMALANASVPAGLEIRESDDVLPSSWPTLNGKRPAWFNADPTLRIPVTDVVQAFNAQRRDYHVVQMRGVLAIRPIGGTLPFLDEPSSIGAPIKVTGVMAAARRVFSPLDPTLLGVILGTMGPGENLPVVLNGSGGPTVIDTLNQIVEQAPPRTWVVTTRKQGDEVRIVSFGFISADGGRRIQGIVRR